MGDETKNTKKNEILVTLIDSSAHIEKREKKNGIIGPYGHSAKENDNGERLVEWCTNNEPCRINTYPQHKKRYKLDIQKY